MSDGYDYWGREVQRETDTGKRYVDTSYGREYVEPPPPPPPPPPPANDGW